MKSLFISFLVIFSFAFSLLAQTGIVKDNLSLSSKILNMDRKFAIYLPPGYGTSERNYPVLYLLHGSGDDQTGWIQFGEVLHIADKAINEAFNISTPVATSVLELAEMVWNKINPDKPFRYTSDEPFTYDVQKRIPDVTKAKEILGFEANISLSDSVDEVISYMRK